MAQLRRICGDSTYTLKWVEKGNLKLADSAFCRAREMFAGAYMSADCSSLAWLDKYYGQFAMAVRNKK